jgi:hypothetical protein
MSAEPGTEGRTLTMRSESRQHPIWIGDRRPVNWGAAGGIGQIRRKPD